NTEARSRMFIIANLWRLYLLISCSCGTNLKPQKHIKGKNGAVNRETIYLSSQVLCFSWRGIETPRLAEPVVFPSQAFNRILHFHVVHVGEVTRQRIHLCSNLFLDLGSDLRTC